MKLVLFTPVIATSAIGRMATLVAQAMRDLGHQVDVVRTEDPSFFDQPTHGSLSHAIWWNNRNLVRSTMVDADATVFQIGDHYGFHQGALHWMPELRGVVCLHDFFLGHLFCGWSQSRMPEAQSVLQSWYGDSLKDRFFGLAAESFIAETAQTTPMTEWICAMALGVVTHSEWGCERVLESCAGPVRVVPLAYDRAPPAEVPAVSGASTFSVLTIGHVNANKRIESVIEAIAGSPTLRRAASYRLVGDVQHETAAKLAAMARARGVELVVTGAVDDQQLSLAIEQADVVSCLRWPSLEAASASAIEAMLYGKPTIVTDVGFYRDIPDECTFKIDPANESRQLRETLEFLQAQPERGHAVGRKAQEWARVTFTADNYARELIAMIEDAAVVQPTLDAIQYFADVLRRWSASPSLLTEPALAAPLRIFGQRPTSGSGTHFFPHTEP